MSFQRPASLQLADCHRHHAELVEVLATCDQDSPNYPSYKQQLRDCRAKRVALLDALGSVLPGPTPTWRSV